jgi:hypothetical protein
VGTVLTNVITGRPARSIISRLIREVGPLSELAPAFPLAANAITQLRIKAEPTGSGDFSPSAVRSGRPIETTLARRGTDETPGSRYRCEISIREIAGVT